jgi:hypothetical protein
MKKVYQNPEILLCEVANEDVITTSELKLYQGNGVSGGEDVITW